MSGLQNTIWRRLYIIMPTNLYGPYDNFDLQTSHVMPALLRKTHEAKLSKQKEVTVWGTGKPLREFMHVNDCAEGIIFLLENYSGQEPINLGSGQEVSIKNLIEMIKLIVGFEGKINFDYSKPDGTPRKFLNSDKIRALGWEPKFSWRMVFWILIAGILSNSHNIKILKKFMI